MEKCIRLLIADDAPRSRAGLRALLATFRLSSCISDQHVQVGQGFRMRGSETQLPIPLPEVEVVGEAADGQQAVRMAEECRPDVVLMDARMPVMNGLEATRLIKNKWPEVKIVVLTLYPTYRAEALAAGADVFLIKGCPPEELLEAILDD